MEGAIDQVGRKNKIRYVAKDKPKKLIGISGVIGLLYADDAQLDAPEKGDFKVFPKCEELHEAYFAQYEALGFSGYFKVDVWDGRSWCPVVLAEIFPERTHYFGKKDLPIDCYHLCYDVLHTLKGRQLARTYREHYELVDDEI